MLVERKERAVEELCNVTESDIEPEITPVLRGSFRMQGPVDDIDHHEKNTASSLAVKRFCRRSVSQKGRVELCSTPCSSCIHLNQVLMDSKGNEFSDESCHGHSSSWNAVKKQNVLHTNKSGAGESLEHATCETSNQISSNSSHNSYTENVESKATLKSSDTVVDFELLPKPSCGRTVDEDQFSVKPKCDYDQITVLNNDSKDVEGHDDNTSCVSRANDGSILCNGNVNRKSKSLTSASVGSSDREGCGVTINSQTSSGGLNTGGNAKVIRGNSIAPGGHADTCMQKLPPISLPTELVSGKLNSSEFNYSDDITVSTSVAKVQGPDFISQSCKSFSTNPIDEVLEEDTSLHHGKLTEFSMEHMNSLLTKETAFDTVCDRKSAAYQSADICQKNDRTFAGGTHEILMKISSKMEVETNKGSGELPREALKVELSEVHDPHLQSPSGDETEESDVVEHDVKVCDICGDAGREDLLATCSRCSDGAEHTYCMRDMLQKVPEGDWLCEECKVIEENANQKQVSDIEGKGTIKVNASTQVSGKRKAGSVEDDSTTKRQALETSIGSPKTSSPSKATVLSRDSSFKNLDKGRVKTAHEAHHGNQSSNDAVESVRSPTSTPRLQSIKGTFTKSNSFSTLSSKPKIKVVDDVVLQKQKVARENASHDMEGRVKMMGKSMSFKSPNLSRSNLTEPKVKMLSSKITHAQELKGPKQVKEHKTFERKSLSKLDRPSVNSTKISSSIPTPKADVKLSSRGEVLHSSISNNQDLKVGQSDSKLKTSSKSSNHMARKGPEVPSTSVGALSNNGLSSYSAEQKSNHASPKDEPSSSSSWTAEKPSKIVNGVLQDGFPRSGESNNQPEKTRESSSSRPKHTFTTGSRSLNCQKCKEVGHDAECCTVCGPLAGDIDASSVRSLRGESNKENKLKAAITAAMLKKPGRYNWKRLDKVDELPVSRLDINSDMASQDQSLVPNHMKQLTGFPTEASYSPEMNGSDSIISSNVKPPVGDLPSPALAATCVDLRMSAIPEHEYIWQGGFEVYRGGRQPDLCDGFQAHLSTYASPKVLGVVNKFPLKVPLIEVPRLSTWPTQFYDSGAKEDNIALYFFAKDLESYQRNYKSLVESMMKNDVALKGDLDGVELLIFPSNHLPRDSQRWNMLFFLWGVFRARRVDDLDQKSGSSKKLYIPNMSLVPLEKDISPAITSVTELTCFTKCKDEDVSSCSGSFNVFPDSNFSASVKSPMLSSSRTINEYSDTKFSSIDQTCIGSPPTLERQDNMLDSLSHSLSRIPTSNEELHPEGGRCSISVNEPFVPDRKQDFGTSATKIDININKVEKMPLPWDISLDRQNTSSHSSETPFGNLESNVKGSIVELHRMKSSPDQLNHGTNIKEECFYLDTEPASKIHLAQKEPNCPQFDRKRLRLDAGMELSQAPIGTGQTMPWNDVNSNLAARETASKKLKTGSSGMFGCNTSEGTNYKIDGYPSQIHDLGSSIVKQMDDGACDKKVILEDLGPTERYFFPVASHSVRDLQLGVNSMPWNDEDRFHDHVPNLELALGAETTPPNRGMLPFLVGMVDEKINILDQPLDKVTVEKEEDDVSASLSLSLSFPFPDKEQTRKPVSLSEQLLPERHHVNTSLILFDGLRDK